MMKEDALEISRNLATRSLEFLPFFLKSHNQLHRIYALIPQFRIKLSSSVTI